MTSRLRILHCLRAPVGGLFRHVCDLVRAQAEMGYEVGIVCDANTGGAQAAQTLARLRPVCALDIHRIPMSRNIGLRDVLAVRTVRRIAAGTGAQILHGHGAKGGAYARLVGKRLKRAGRPMHCFYTPHGGSLHYTPDSLTGRLYLRLEQKLAPHTDGLIFESAYSADLYEAKIGPYPCPARVIPNGLRPDEFYDIEINADASDFLFVGELRSLKGVDVFIEAISQLNREREAPATALIIGSGPEEEDFRRMVLRSGLTQAVRFTGAMPAARAFVRGRCLVIPSRAESFPYIALEAAAASMPLIMTCVGGIPEIVEGTDCVLVASGDATALKSQMALFLAEPEVFVARARTLQSVVSDRYSLDGMAQAIVTFYSSINAAGEIPESTVSEA